MLGPAVAVNPNVPAFASAGGMHWRCKAGPKGISVWHTWLRLFMPTCTVVGDGIGLFRRVEHGTTLTVLLAGLFHDLRDCEPVTERLSFARLLSGSIDEGCFWPLLHACDVDIAVDWHESTALARSFGDLESSLLGSRAAPLPHSLHEYWKRLCMAYRTLLDRLMPESVSELRGYLHPLVVRAFGNQFVAGGLS